MGEFRLRLGQQRCGFLEVSRFDRGFRLGADLGEPALRGGLLEPG